MLVALLPIRVLIPTSLLTILRRAPRIYLAVVGERERVIGAARNVADVLKALDAHRKTFIAAFAVTELAKYAHAL